MTSKKIDNPLIAAANPKLRFEVFQKHIIERTKKVLDGGSYILGNEVAGFEKAFAEYIGAEFCISVNSCTDALTLSLKAMNLAKGAEVITTGLTAPATVIGILNAGLKPVIVDVSEGILCISPSAIKQAITSQTKAIVAVHLHGYAAPLDQIINICAEHDLKLIEDCAQSHGASLDQNKLGSIGDCGVFSFYPTKNLGCPGDGGAITTSDPILAEKLYELRNYGFGDNGIIENIGFNSRMDELQAGILNVLLPHLDEYNKRRVTFAKAYHDALQEYVCNIPPLVEGSVYHQFTLRVKDRDEFQNKLLSRGINTGIHYPLTMIDHPAFAKYCQPLPRAKQAAKSLVSLPIQPELLDHHFDKIIIEVEQLLSSKNY